MEMKTYKRRRNGVDVHSCTDQRSKADVLSDEQLLPEISNEITFDLIIPKLPGTAFHALSSVSRCWKEAIQTRQVYGARLRANSTETFIVHPHFDVEKTTTLALYSTSEKRCYELPPIPFRASGRVYELTCIELDGKLYVLGGKHLWGNGRVDSIGEVYVLDLAGCKGWKRCANMLQARSNFSCGVMDGKIYIFGGTFFEGKSSERLVESEVYDIEENSWDPIRPIPSTYVHHRITQVVATTRKELLLCDGTISTSSTYNPAKNEWRQFDRFQENDHSLGPLFVKKEKFYLFSPFGIQVYDVKQHTWRDRHTNYFPTVNVNDLVPFTILAVRDELLLTALCPSSTPFPFLRKSFQCKGFDTENKELVWHETNCLDLPKCRFKCSIQL